jgi:hypothetical protein
MIEFQIITVMGSAPVDTMSPSALEVVHDAETVKKHLRLEISDPRSRWPCRS